MKNKPATIKQIAQIMAVSISTVSRALHDHPSISLVTREKIKKIAIDLNYEPNERAILFQKGKSLTIGVILPELSESFFSTAISTIEDCVYKRNYNLIVAQSHDNEEREKELVNKLKAHQVDGLLISIAKTTINFDHFDLLKKHKIPVVFFDRIPPIKDIHYVACNIETGSIAAVNYLLKLGHRTIGLINGPNTLLASGQRKEGYIKALQKNRLKYDPSLIVNCDLTEEGTRYALSTLLLNKRKPTAIVTFNDYIAAFAIKFSKSLAKEINTNLAFVSYANSPMINFMENGPVASVEQFPAIQAKKAVDVLFDLINNDVEEQAYFKVVIESELVPNNTNS